MAETTTIETKLEPDFRPKLTLTKPDIENCSNPNKPLSIKFTLKIINMIKFPFDFTLFKKIQNKITQFVFKLILFVCDNNCNNHDKFRNIDIIRRI